MAVAWITAASPVRSAFFLALTHPSPTQSSWPESGRGPGGGSGFTFGGSCFGGGAAAPDEDEEDPPSVKDPFGGGPLLAFAGLGGGGGGPFGFTFAFPGGGMKTTSFAPTRYVGPIALAAGGFPLGESTGSKPARRAASLFAAAFFS